MMRICLIHWNAEERVNKCARLQGGGFFILDEIKPGPQFLRELEKQAPDAMVIDLSRLPSQGRDLGVMVRSREGTRRIPIVFIGGEVAKVDAIQQLLPDACYTDWEAAFQEIQKAIESENKDFAAQRSVFSAYAGKPLSEKLGIKPGYHVSIINAPGEVWGLLKEGSVGAAFSNQANTGPDLFLWFMSSTNELENSLEQIVTHVKTAPGWIAWPKKGSGIQTDLTQNIVRQKAMSAGMVDYKICSIDENWSGLLFTWRGFHQDEAQE